MNIIKLGTVLGGIYVMGVKFSCWIRCNLIRMDQGGIWLNLMRLVFATLKLNLTKLVSEEKAIPNLDRHPV